MANQWFKFYGGEYLSDPKILQLTAQERSCWVTLLCLANQSESGVVKFLSEKQLLALSGITQEIPNILTKFEKLEMIRIRNGIVTVINWEKRQMSEAYSRVKQFRKRQSNANDNDRREEKEEKRDKEDSTNPTPKQDANKFFEMVREAGEEFNQFITAFVLKTGVDEIIIMREVKKFVNYWTEKNKSGTKQKWELQKTFEVQRRLATWFGNASQWSKEKANNKSKTLIV